MIKYFILSVLLVYELRASPTNRKLFRKNDHVATVEGSEHTSIFGGLLENNLVNLIRETISNKYKSINAASYSRSLIEFVDINDHEPHPAAVALPVQPALPTPPAPPTVLPIMPEWMEILSMATKIQLTASLPIEIIGIGFDRKMKFILNPPTIKQDETFSVVYHSSTQVSLYLKDNQHWRQEAGPISVTEVILGDGKHYRVEGTGLHKEQGIVIANVVKDLPIIPTASPTLMPTLIPTFVPTHLPTKAPLHITLDPIPSPPLIYDRTSKIKVGVRGLDEVVDKEVTVTLSTPSRTLVKDVDFSLYKNNPTSDHPGLTLKLLPSKR